MSDYMILAKPNETLMEHTENTLKVFKSIKNAYPEVPELCNVPNFWEYLFYTLFFHDFGKGAMGFQNSLRNNTYWNYRHEILSASFVVCLKNKIPDFYIKAISMGIITHHKDVLILREKYQTRNEEGKRVFIEKLNELKDNFNELISYFDYIPKFSEEYLGYKLDIPNKINFNDLSNEYLNTVQHYFLEYEDEEFTELHGKFGIFLKGFTNACDYLASGSKYNILNGIKNIKNIYNFDKLRKTQEISSKTEGSSFLIAPTGSGKTESSLLWADYNQNEMASKRVFYFLPYTASINAMYNRLVNDFNDEELVGLIHGKSSYFLYRLFENSNYNESKDKIKSINNLTKKIYRPYKVLTPFQIIKYFFGVKGFEMGLSEMSNCLIIIDEIHAYDAHTTSLFLEILKVLKKEYNVSIFIMSATLPTFLLNLFQKSLNINNIISMNNKELDTFTRHRINILEGNIEEYFSDILNDIKSNKKVLIVCNTIKKAQTVFNWFEDKNIPNISLLHSKFILKDRENIEKNLNNLNLLVGTQAIEVSLDISYDILYTEPAPLDALIQRFGRINRKGWEKNIIRDVNICSLGSETDKYVYDMSLINKTLEILKNVGILYESKIQSLLDYVYGESYNSKDQEEFDLVKKNFNEVYNNLVPFINQKDSQKLFYNLFKSFEVVPQKYKLDYLNKIGNNEFYEAMSYTLSISSNFFYNLYKNDDVEFVNDTYFVNLEYDSKLGLLNKEESNFFD